MERVVSVWRMLQNPNLNRPHSQQQHVRSLQKGCAVHGGGGEKYGASSPSLKAALYAGQRSFSSPSLRDSSSLRFRLGV